MGASLYFGKDLHFVEPGDDGGALKLTGSFIECTNMSWSSISELWRIAADKLGIPADDWPFYGEVELEEGFPLDEVKAKCARLRVILGNIPETDLPENKWLRDLARILQKDWDFCAKSW